MTANEFIRRIQTKVSMLSTGDIPIKLNGEDIECVIELIENGKGYYINIKQLTKDLALTPEDVVVLVNLYEYGKANGWTAEDVIRRFNEQRKKWKQEKKAHRNGRSTKKYLVRTESLLD